MNEFVGIAIIPRVEGLSAYLALEGLFPGVYSQVLLVVFGVNKAGVAFLTLIRTLSCVNTHNVIDQQSLPLECLITTIALISLLLEMCSSLVGL